MLSVCFSVKLRAPPFISQGATYLQLITDDGQCVRNVAPDSMRCAPFSLHRFERMSRTPKTYIWTEILFPCGGPRAAPFVTGPLRSC